MLATSPNGERTLALWLQRDLEAETTVGVATSWYRGGGRWSTAELIDRQRSVPLPANAAVDDAGNAIVVWMQGNPDTRLTDAWGSWYDRNDGWREPVPLIQSASSGFRATPLIAFDSDGSVLLTWVLERPVDDSLVTLSRCQNGQLCEDLDAFGVRLFGGTLSAMSLGAGGRVTVITSGPLPAGNRYDPATGWGVPATFDDPALKGIPLVQIDDGVAWAFWPGSESTGSANGVARYAGDGWEEPMILGPPCPDLCPIDTTCNCLRPGIGSIALDQQGGAIVVWGYIVRGDDPAGSKAGALWSRYAPGQGWGSTESFPVGDDGGIPIASLSILDDGTAIALWYQRGVNASGTLRLSVWANGLDPTGWGDPTFFTDAGVLNVPNQPSVPNLVSRGTRAMGLWLQQPSTSSTRDDGWSTPWASEFR